MGNPSSAPPPAPNDPRRLKQTPPPPPNDPRRLKQTPPPPPPGARRLTLEQQTNLDQVLGEFHRYIIGAGESLIQRGDEESFQKLLHFLVNLGPDLHARLLHPDDPNSNTRHTIQKTLGSMRECLQGIGFGKLLDLNGKEIRDL